jgi:hypothetical protein
MVILNLYSKLFYVTNQGTVRSDNQKILVRHSAACTGASTYIQYSIQYYTIIPT